MDSCKRIVKEKYELVIYCHDRREEMPVIWLPVLEEEEGGRVYNLLQEKCVLICILCRDWNSELSPWHAEEVFPGGHFDQPEARMAAGIDCLLKNSQDKIK